MPLVPIRSPTPLQNSTPSMFLKTLNRFLSTHSMLVLDLQFRPRRIVMHPPHALSAAAHTVLMVAMFSRTLSSSIVTTVETANRFDGMLPLEPPPSLAQTAKSRCHTLVSMQSKLMGWSKNSHIVQTRNPKLLRIFRMPVVKHGATPAFF